MVFCRFETEFGQDLNIKNMPKRKILIGLILLGLYSCKTTAQFSTLSKRMDACSGIVPTQFGYHDIRMMLYDSTQLKSMWQKKDTLYVLHNYTLESAEFHTRIWSSHDSLSYDCQFKHLKENGGNAFRQSQVFLVRKWDTTAIRKYAEASEQIHGGTIFAYRLIPHGKKYSFECINFNDFIVPEIDLIHREKERHLK